MRSKLLSFLLALSLSACTFQVEVLNTPTPSPEPTLLPFSSPTPAVNLDLSAVPQFTDTPTPYPPPPASGIVSVVFPPNGTAQIMAGSIAAGSSQTYSLDAFQGQVMSVSIFSDDPGLQGLFQLEIKGSDGTVLCPVKNYDCSFWRGTLPSTQRYEIKVTQETGGNFKMRVAINPPGQANQYFEYVDQQGRYTFTSNDEFAPINYGGIQAFKFMPEVTLEYIDSKQYVPTNLSEAYFLVGSGTDAQSVSTCTEPGSFGGPEELTGTRAVNGVMFTASHAVGLGAGNIYEQFIYRGVYNGTCYEVTYFIHYTNVGNYVPGAVTEFNEDVLMTGFDQILATFMFK